MNKRQITLSDLAKELGISTATVSRALKDYPDISNKTKKRVLELANKWNYRPNTIAAGLRKQESRVIGVIIPEIVNHFFSSVIKGIMEVANREDYGVMLCQSDEAYEKEKKNANALYSGRVDGLLVSLAHGTKDLAHFQDFQDAGVPLVFFDKVPDASQFSNISRVVVDDKQGAYNLVTHLIDQGAKHIANFRGPMTAYTSRNRYEGYEKAMHEHQLAIDSHLIYDCQEMDMQEGAHFATQIVQSGRPCDAICCINDRIAIGAMDALKQLGKKVPTDIIVAGFSDWEVSKVIEPSLTSVAQPSLEMGKRAMELLLAEINANKQEIPVEYTFVELSTELQIRRSTNQQASPKT